MRQFYPNNNIFAEVPGEKDPNSASDATVGKGFDNQSTEGITLNSVLWDIDSSIENFKEGIIGTLNAIADGHYAKVLESMTAYGPGAFVAGPIGEVSLMKVGYTVNLTKFDYCFGRVISGPIDNIRRSAQNLKDLTTLGIKNESQLIKVFNQASNGVTIKTITSEYGTTVRRRALIGDKGAIDVGFFYKGGNMSATPSISTIIPKIF